MKDRNFDDIEKGELHKVADEFQNKGYTAIKCAGAIGDLSYVGNHSSYRSVYENKCCIILSCRGI